MATSTNNWYHDLPPEGKRIMHVLGLILITGLTLSSFAFAYSYIVSAHVAERAGTSSRQISVNGEGEISLRPDTAVFDAGVITQAKRVSDAQHQNSQRSHVMIDLLKQRGVAEKDIKTISYSITPQYVYSIARPCIPESCPPQRPPEIVGYEVRNTIEIKVRDLTKTDTLLEDVASAGANEISSLSFRVDDEEIARAQARAKAIADAKMKASVLARDLGIRLGRIVGYSDQEGVPPPIYGGGLQMMRADAVESTVPQVQPGEQEIHSSVTVTYEFR